MSAINLPGQLEVPLVVDHKPRFPRNPQELADQIDRDITDIMRARLIAESLRLYEQRPTSETWSRIQALAAEILK